jgi:Zn-dependent M28 family amino/carboxypeptidase
MSGLLLLVFTLVDAGDPFPYAAAEAELSVEIGVHELKAHVYRLASPEFLGRRGAGAARASQHLRDAFERLHLEPAFQGSYFQSIPSLLASASPDQPSFIGRNVGALLPGTDPALRNEWVVLSAHFDHLGKVGPRWYPGADDNASGVAALLEIAEHFALQKVKPRRTVVFVAFDQEEAGLLGSSYFARHPPRPIAQLKAFLTADMIGRSMVNLMDEYVFVLGSEHSRRLRRLLEEVPLPNGLKVGRVGADLIGTRSDYGPFRDRQIPFLFFSTGQHPDYHQPTDLPERVDYAKLQRIALFMNDLVWRLSNDGETPRWDDKPLGPDLDEVRTVLTLVARVLDNPKVFPLTPKQRELVVGVRERLGGMVKRGEVSADERTWLLWTARFLMATVF